MNKRIKTILGYTLSITVATSILIGSFYLWVWFINFAVKILSI